jgi:hypothetical protein
VFIEYGAISLYLLRSAQNQKKTVRVKQIAAVQMVSSIHGLLTREKCQLDLPEQRVRWVQKLVDLHDKRSAQRQNIPALVEIQPSPMSSQCQHRDRVMTWLAEQDLRRPEARVACRTRAFA